MAENRHETTTNQSSKGGKVWGKAGGGPTGSNGDQRWPDRGGTGLGRGGFARGKTPGREGRRLNARRRAGGVDGGPAACGSDGELRLMLQRPSRSIGTSSSKPRGRKKVSTAAEEGGGEAEMNDGVAERVMHGRGRGRRDGRRRSSVSCYFRSSSTSGSLVCTKKKGRKEFGHKGEKRDEREEEIRVDWSKNEGEGSKVS
ncbi:uncharacterized protein LOC120288386 [Eucalyptus grandis]|uniref:uncharacterized protein LOC120288386 n=1 Tax=Eucalyptus grandis TaxID=71139 RepID=UPI00192EF80C|nr:uncharacterized protein LOC120288386 [Eucalyptus grandis]